VDVRNAAPGRGLEHVFVLVGQDVGGLCQDLSYITAYVLITKCNRS
jgi:hypothetical protein